MKSPIFRKYTGIVLALLLTALPALSCSLLQRASEVIPVEELQSTVEAAVEDLPLEDETEEEVEESATESSPSQPEQPQIGVGELDSLLPQEGSGEPGIACFSSFDGINCLDESGWHLYTDENSSLGSSQISDMAVCPDGRILASQTFGVSVFDGQNWANIPMGDIYSPSSVFCDANNNIWIAHWEGASVYDGLRWTTHSSDLMATGEIATGLVNDVAVAPDGTVWAITTNSIASYDGSTWTIYQPGQGLDDTYFFSNIVIDHQGRPWAAHSSGFVMMDGGEWIPLEMNSFSTINNAFIDSQDFVWAGTYSGLAVFHDGVWSTFDTDSGYFTTDTIKAVVVDASGRLWASTTYGLHVYDGQNWTVYYMHNSGLNTNDITSMVVLGAGPSLPAIEEKMPGILTGQLIQDEKPLANINVEVCVEIIGYIYSGETPCSDQPFKEATITDDQGVFRFDSLPPGNYVITAQFADGTWAQLETEYGTTSITLVEEGLTTDVGQLIAGED